MLISFGYVQYLIFPFISSYKFPHIRTNVYTDLVWWSKKGISIISSSGSVTAFDRCKTNYFKLINRTISNEHGMWIRKHNYLCYDYQYVAWIVLWRIAIKNFTTNFMFLSLIKSWYLSSIELDSGYKTLKRFRSCIKIRNGWANAFKIYMRFKVDAKVR